MIKFSKNVTGFGNDEEVTTGFLAKNTGLKGKLPKKEPNKAIHMFGNIIIEEDNTGWNKLIDNIEPVVKNEFVAVDIGLFEPTSPKIIDRGIRNEMGIGTPQRSFIALTFDIKRKQLERIVLNAMGKWFMSNEKALNALDSAGKYLQKEIRELMYGDYWLKRKPNKPLTVAKKGFNQPLIETGELARNINRRKTTGKKKAK